MGHCHFMAWHTLRDALKMTGRSRSQFYRDMRAGLVSYRTGRDGRREFETSELFCTGVFYNEILIGGDEQCSQGRIL